MTRHIHLDVGGGIAGDMFAAAMVSAFPEAEANLISDWQAAGLSQHIEHELENVLEKGFAASRLKLRTAGEVPPTHGWREIKLFLQDSALSSPVKARAIKIFSELARAEAHCHDVEIENVHFHEIADWDSLADIVGAASVIEFASASSWSVSTLPIGGGRVRTQHGLINIPAPATIELLKGFEFHDDGGKGERITPTGAAILRHLNPSQSQTGRLGSLTNSGAGAGHMQIEGIPNLLRISCFEQAQDHEFDEVTMIRFEIDDMTPEELALSMDRLRGEAGTLDVNFVMGVGKKGRPVFMVSVMSEPHHSDTIIEQCFNETSTIGLRIESVRRRKLSRSNSTRDNLRVKTVDRPDGSTTKVECDDLQSIPKLGARRAIARRIENDDA